jgi:hypothetical protein
VGERFSASVQIGSGTHPASYTVGTGSFPGVQRPGRGADHPPSSSAEVKERVVIHLLPLWAFVKCSKVNCTFYERGSNRKKKKYDEKLHNFALLANVIRVTENDMGRANSKQEGNNIYPTYSKIYFRI